MAVSIALSSCTKEGATGPQGANGVANISTNIYEITPSMWSWVGVGTYPTCSITVTAITNSNADDVEVFASDYTDNGDWGQLGTEYQFGYTNGIVNIVYNSTSQEPIWNAYFKVVVIPPSIYVSHPNTNWSDYSQVKAIIDVENDRTK